MKRVVYIASDHAGLKIKESIKCFLSDNNYDYEDYGAFSLNKKDDYPNFIIPCVKEAIKKKSIAIILGGSGQGEAIAANKVKGARAVVIYSYNRKIVELSREHNNSNVLSLGARFLSEKEILSLIKIWLSAKFQGGRHLRRLNEISSYEKKR